MCIIQKLIIFNCGFSTKVTLINLEKQQYLPYIIDEIKISRVPL